jgi:hypothetical protein
MLPATYRGFESYDICVNEDGTEAVAVDIT